VPLNSKSNTWSRRTTTPPMPQKWIALIVSGSLRKPRT
jgi:hypothetical protein